MHLSLGNGILRVAAMVGVGSATVVGTGSVTTIPAALIARSLDADPSSYVPARMRALPEIAWLRRRVSR
jgi:hypothetical protein